MPVQQISVSPMGGSINNNSNISTNGVNKLQDRSTSGNVVSGIPSMVSCANNAGGVGYDSQTSSLSSNSYDICRICHCEGDSEVPLIAPCYCAGSLRYVHQVCLQQWIKSSNIRSCELCKFQFIMQTKTKPFSQWEHLEMSGFERRKLICAVMFHAVALTCVVWSLYVLIDRTAEEIQTGILEWPFWTKLIVVAIGFTGGVVFMYIQCKAYLQICQRWKAFNRVIYVQNAPEKPGLSPSHSASRLRNESTAAAHASMPLAASVSNIDNRHTIQPSSSEFKPYQDGVREGNYNSDSDRDKTSIDLKGVRNLHIFFNDENRIHVQKERSPSCKIDCLDDNEVYSGIDYNNITSNNGFNSNNVSNNGQICPSDNQSSMSWHIKIGKTASTSSDSCVERVDTRLGDLNQLQDEVVRSTGPPSNLESPVLKLQIKKAEIVIKFGQSGSSTNQTNSLVGTSTANTEALALMNDEPSKPASFNIDDGNESSVNIKFDGCETDTNEPIFIDLVQNQSNATSTEHNDNPSTSAASTSNPLQIRLDFGCKDISDTSRSISSNGANSTEITMINKNALKILPSSSSSSQLLPSSDNMSRPASDKPFSSRVTGANDSGSKSEPGSGSQSPLLAHKECRHNQL